MTYQTVALAAVHQAIHNLNDLDPKIEHAIPLV